MLLITDDIMTVEDAVVWCDYTIHLSLSQHSIHINAICVVQGRPEVYVIGGRVKANFDQFDPAWSPSQAIFFFTKLGHFFFYQFMPFFGQIRPFWTIQTILNNSDHFFYQLRSLLTNSESKLGVTFPLPLLVRPSPLQCLVNWWTTQIIKRSVIIMFIMVVL